MHPGCQACEDSAPLFDACPFHTVSYIDFDETPLRPVRLVDAPPDDMDW